MREYLKGLFGQKQPPKDTSEHDKMVRWPDFNIDHPSETVTESSPANETTLNGQLPIPKETVKNPEKINPEPDQPIESTTEPEIIGTLDDEIKTNIIDPLIVNLKAKGATTDIETIGRQYNFYKKRIQENIGATPAKQVLISLIDEVAKRNNIDL